MQNNELAEPLTVAALALTYREANAPWDSFGFSAIASIFLHHLEESGDYDYDLVILDLIEEQPARRLAIARALATETLWDNPARAEAIIHAWPLADGGPPRARWAKPFRGARWLAVEHEMRTLLNTGLAVPRGHVDAIAEAAYASAGGTPL